MYELRLWICCSLIVCIHVSKICDVLLGVLIAEFGEKEVSILIAHYKPVLEAAKVKIDDVDTERSMLKLEIYARWA